MTFLTELAEVLQNSNNALAGVFLHTHAKEIVALVEAAENAMLVYQTNAQNYPIAVAMEKMREALDALNKDQV
jgi:hypothetical protein